MLHQDYQPVAFSTMTKMCADRLFDAALATAFDSARIRLCDMPFVCKSDVASFIVAGTWMSLKRVIEDCRRELEQRISTSKADALCPATISDVITLCQALSADTFCRRDGCDGHFARQPVG